MKRHFFAWAALGASLVGCAPTLPPRTSASSADARANVPGDGATDRSAPPNRSDAGGRGASTAARPVAETAIPASWVLAEHADGPGCFGLSRADELLCLADRRVIQARSMGNDELVACFRRRGTELRTAYRLAEATREHLRTTGESASIDRARLAAAERVLERDYASLESCAGPMGRERDSVRVIAPDLPATDG